MKFFLKYLLILNMLFTLPSYATVWPVFLSPDKEFLLRQGYIKTYSCPSSMGQMPSNQKIPVRSFCKTYCPPTWNWVSSNHELCHELATGFLFREYRITYVRNSQTGVVRQTQVIAIYGRDDSKPPFFTLTFTTPNNNWYCYEMNQDTHALVCANDI